MRYTDSYWQGIYCQQSKNWWWKGKEKVIKFFLDRYAKLNLNSRVLDIGCGPGFTVRLLNSYCKGFGIDMFDQALSFCSSQGSGYFAKAKAEALPFKDDTFDGVTLIDSLEHMEDDQRVISECHRITKRNGFLLLFVPAYPQLWTQRDICFGHKRRYSYPALRKLLRGRGFITTRISYTNSFLLPVLFFLAVFEKISGCRIRVDNEGVQNLNPLVNGVLSRILEMEAELIQKFNLPFGSSIVCVAEKKDI